MSDARFYAPLIAITRDTDWGRVTPLRSGGARVDYRLAEGDVVHARGPRGDGSDRGGRRGIRRAGPGQTRWRWDRPADEGSFGFPAYLDRLSRFDFRPHHGAVFSAHQLGTARMGEAADIHAATRAGGSGGRSPAYASQTFRGLYVADASLFPTAIGVNPMLTVMLLARRVARTVIAEAAALRG